MSIGPPVEAPHLGKASLQPLPAAICLGHRIPRRLGRRRLCRLCRRLHSSQIPYSYTRGQGLTVDGVCMLRASQAHIHRACKFHSIWLGTRTFVMRKQYGLDTCDPWCRSGCMLTQPAQTVNPVFRGTLAASLSSTSRTAHLVGCQPPLLLRHRPAQPHELRLLGRERPSGGPRCLLLRRRVRGF